MPFPNAPLQSPTICSIIVVIDCCYFHVFIVIYVLSSTAIFDEVTSVGDSTRVCVRNM